MGVADVLQIGAAPPHRMPEPPIPGPHMIDSAAHHISTCRAYRRPPRYRAGALYRLLLWALIPAISAPGCGGCGGSGPSGDPYAAWGGMSQEEYIAMQRQHQAEEDRKDAEETKKLEESKAKQDEARAAARAEAEEEKKKKAEARSTAVANSASAGRAEAVQIPPLPDLVSDWKETDFYIARVKNDPALIPAVEHLGEHSTGNEDTARLLVRLLQPRVLAELRDKWSGADKAGRTVSSRSVPAYRRTGARGVGADLITTIVAALGTNGTPTAQQALKQLLTGELETENEKSGAEAALEALAANPSAENENLLFYVLTLPHKVRLPDQEGVSPEDLRKKALELLQERAGVGFRVRVARFMIDPATPDEDRKILEKLIYDPQSRNLEAQIVLYRSTLTDHQTKADIEGYFVNYSSEALSYMLGIRRPDLPGQDSDTPPRVARWLWGPKFNASLRYRLERIETLEQGSQVAILAGTVPTDSVRSMLYRTLLHNWREGPVSLQETGFLDDVVCDPGLLVLLKMLCRENTTEREFRRDMRHLSATQREEMSDIVKARQEVEESWATTISDLVNIWSVRFREAAALEAARSGSHAAQPVDLPFGLRPDANVLDAYQFDWPSSVKVPADGLPSDSMQIRYARIEEITTLLKLKAYYSRQLKSFEEHETDHGVWLDALTRSEDDPGRKQTVDVVITAANPNLNSYPGETERYVVDILCLEIKDPSGSTVSRVAEDAVGSVSSPVAAR